MDVDDDMTEIHRKVEYELDALSAEIDNIDELDNIDQLDLLIKEITIIDNHNVIPTAQWYEDRIAFIRLYNDLNWDYLINKFNGRNPFIYQTSIQIKATMTTVLEQWGSGPFSLDQYRFIVYNVRNVWTHYKANYVGDVGYDMEDLLIDMTHL